MRGNSAIQRVEREVGEDLAGDDSVYGVRAGDTSERDEVEKALGGRADRYQSRAVQRIRQTQALERAAQRITQRGGKAHARLGVVRQIVQHVARQIEIVVTQ